MIILYIIIAIVLALAIYVLQTYNKFVKLDNQIKEAFSTMDIYLKKRWDLVPNLVEIVKGYAKYENNTLKEIVELRNNSYNKMSKSEKVNTNARLSVELDKIIVIAENYPELKANDNFKELSTQLAKIEEDIANARKYYNGAVRIYNNNVQVFPNNVIASIFGYKEQKMFEMDSSEKEKMKKELGKIDE